MYRLVHQASVLVVALLVKVDSGAYHSCTVAVVAVLDLGTWLMAFAITALTSGLNIYCNFLIHAFGSLCKCQLHHVLRRNKWYSSACLVK